MHTLLLLSVDFRVKDNKQHGCNFKFSVSGNPKTRNKDTSEKSLIFERSTWFMNGVHQKEPSRN
jgi:hypothetical protein